MGLGMAGELPDLTGMSARERRIFAMGAHWAEGAALDAVVATLRASIGRGDALSTEEVLTALILAFTDCRDLNGVLGFLRAEGATR